ncbi:MAG: hypothetical protein H0X29_01485 [Parachlamydiaceae bacterium]|nr:hypothetical protein [Parachlamydiaceae bacterium]
MTPSERIKNWNQYTNTNIFMNHVHGKPKKISCIDNQLPMIPQCSEICKTAFDNKAKKVLDKIKYYLDKHKTSFGFKDMHNLQQLSKKVEDIFLKITIKTKNIKKNCKNIIDTIQYIESLQINENIATLPTLNAHGVIPSELTQEIIDIINGYRMELPETIQLLVKDRSLVNEADIMNAITPDDREDTINGYIKSRQVLIEKGSNHAVKAIDDAFLQLFLPVPEAIWLAKYPQLRGEEGKQENDLTQLRSKANEPSNYVFCFDD